MLRFKKNVDPISERSRELTTKIAELEARIRKLNQRAEPGNRPRYRSTAYPQGPLPSSRSAAPAPSGEPVFEPVDQHPLKAAPDSRPTAVPRNDLGAPKYDLTALCKRVKKYFSGPPAANPRLINYLAAGNVHGLRPLRKEKRIARNRFLTLALIFVAVLFGIFFFLARPR